MLGMWPQSRVPSIEVTFRCAILIGLTTAQSLKPSYYHTGGRRPRVDDMMVSHDEQLLKIIVQRHILV